MEIDHIRQLITNGESDFLEFKKSTGELRSAMQTLCAFLNHKGGIVLIGVTDDKKIVGQHVSDYTKKELANEVNKIEPFADIEILYRDIGNEKQLIILQVEKGHKTPYVHDGKSYIRNQSSTIKMSQERYEQLLYNRKSASIGWENSSTNECKLADLDKTRIQQFIRIAIHEKRLTDFALNTTVKDFLIKFNLLENKQLTNAAVILFCKEHQKQFPQSEIKLARFKGYTKQEFLDNKRFRGNIFDLYEHAITFLNNHLPIASQIEENNPFRMDTPAIPPKVIREALINALCHRDYSSRNGTITVAVFDDRVEIVSNGLLPYGITLEELTKQHPSRPRNRLIADVLYACGMIEQWGRGTQEMLNLCKKAGLSIPHFEEIAGCFSVTLPLKNSFSKTIVADSVDYSITIRQQEILNILQQGTLSRSMIMQKMANPPTSRMIQMDLLKLKEKSLITSEGKAKALTWKLIDR